MARKKELESNYTTSITLLDDNKEDLKDLAKHDVSLSEFNRSGLSDDDIRKATIEAALKNKAERKKLLNNKSEE